MRDSHITDKGCLVFYYNPNTDDYEEAEKEALSKHNLVNKKITTIGLTRKTDFLSQKKDQTLT